MGVPPSCPSASAKFPPAQGRKRKTQNQSNSVQDQMNHPVRSPAPPSAGCVPHPAGHLGRQLKIPRGVGHLCHLPQGRRQGQPRERPAARAPRGRDREEKGRQRRRRRRRQGAQEEETKEGQEAEVATVQEEEQKLEGRREDASTAARGQEKRARPEKAEAAEDIEGKVGSLVESTRVNFETSPD